MLDEPPALPRRTGKPPVADFISELTCSLSSLCRVHVVLVLRNQPDFLASLYAQLSPGRTGRGQEDFENRVIALLDDGDPFLDWHLLATELLEAVGGSRKNLLVAFLEEGMPQIQRRIRRFLDPNGCMVLRESSVSRNRRRSSSGRWHLGPAGTEGVTITIPSNLRKLILQAYGNSNAAVVNKFGTADLLPVYCVQ